MAFQIEEDPSKKIEKYELVKRLELFFTPFIQPCLPRLKHVLILF